MHTSETRVISSRSDAEGNGRETYVVDLEIDGVAKRLTPDRSVWDRLPAGATFPACVRGGGLDSR